MWKAGIGIAAWKFLHLTATGLPAGATHGHTGSNIKSGAHWGIDIIHLYWFHLIKQILFNDIAETSVIKRMVFVSRLIQSHAQWGPGSAATCHHYPDAWNLFLVFQKFFYHLTCLFCYLKHVCLLIVFFFRLQIKYALKSGCQIWCTRKKSKNIIFCHSGESRNPVFSETYDWPGPRLSPGWRLFTNASMIEF